MTGKGWNVIVIVEYFRRKNNIHELPDLIVELIKTKEEIEAGRAGFLRNG